MKLVEVITNESHDWVIVRSEGKLLHEAHNISIIDFCWILRELGLVVCDKEISDKQMEEETVLANMK